MKNILDLDSEQLLNGFTDIAKIVLCWCITIIVLPFVALLYLYKSGVLLICKIIHPDLRPISSLDSNFVVDALTEDDEVKHEHERRQLNIIASCSKIREVKYDLEEFRERVQHKLLDVKSEWSWRYKSYIVRFGGFSFWRECSDFNVEQQVKQVRLEAGDSLRDFVNDWMLTAFPPKSPLWEIVLIESESEEYVAIKLHHAMGDGLSMFEMMNTIFGVQHHSQVQKFLKSTLPRGTVLDVLNLILQSPACVFDILNVVFKSMAQDPFRSRPGNKSEQWLSTHPMNLTDVKMVAKKNGVSVMAVLLSIYAGAIGRFLANNGQAIPDELIIPVPLPRPSRPNGFIGNHFNTMFVPIPIKNPDPQRRLEELQSKMTQFCSSKMFIVMNYIFLHMPSILPLKINIEFRKIVRTRYSLSPVVAVEDYPSYDGRIVEEMYGIGALVFQTFGIMGITTSYNDVLAWAITGAKDIFKTQEDLDLLVKKYIEEELKELVRHTKRKYPDDVPI